MTKGQRIRKARTDLGLSQVELASKIKVSKQTLYKYENDIITNIPSDKIFEISKALDTTPAYLMGWDSSVRDSMNHPDLYPVDVQTFPMLGSIACGEPVYMNPERDSYVKSGTKIHADFCLTARGDSMTGARIYDGDIVFIKRDVDVVNGQIYAVAIDDEATLKRVYVDHEAGEIRLVAENPMYKTMVFTEKDAKDIHVLGRAVAFQSDVV